MCQGTSSAEVWNGGAIPPFPVRFHGVVLHYLCTGTDLFLSIMVDFWGAIQNIIPNVFSGTVAA
jgi:hypothetical protein